MVKVARKNHVTIYHNPRCSKSRQTLALLREEGAQPHIVEYLHDPPDEKTLRSLLKKLGMRPRDLIRRGERIFVELELANSLEDDEALLKAMLQYPILIERPIVVRGNQARLGRPPEKVLDLF